MDTYILFLYGSFDNHEEVEYFCTEVFPGDSLYSIKYIIENGQNLIIIFDTDKTKIELSKELYEILTPDHIKFYFLFERENLVTAHLPESMKDFIFKPIESKDMNDEEEEKVNIMRIDFHKQIDSPSLTLDDILDKIEKMGVASLTPEEKNFLDNFEN
jgi:hypothetical protein